MIELTIRLENGRAFLCNEIPSSVTKALTYWHKTLVFDEATFKRKVSGESRRLYKDASVEIDGKQVRAMAFPYGLVSRVVNVLTTSGYKVTFDDRRISPPTMNAEMGLHGLRPFQHEGFLTMMSNHGGIMQCPTGWGKSHIEAAIIRSVDHDSMVVRGTPLSVLTAPDKDLVRQLHADMCRLLKGREVGCLMSGTKRMSDDVMVVTMDSLHHINPDDVGVLLVDEVHTLATSERSKHVVEMRKAIKWGFSATPAGRFDNADLVTEALVGPVVYTRSYPQGVTDGALVPIKVLWLQAPVPACGAAAIAGYDRHNTKTRYGIVRNEAMAEMIVDILRSTSPEDHQVLCIMDLLEQMNGILKLDNSLQYVHGTTSKDGLDARKHSLVAPVDKETRARVKDEFTAGTIRQLLSTSIYQQGVNFPALTVLINAGGGGSEIAAGQIPGRASRNIEGKDCSYIVDFWYGWNTITDSKTGRTRPDSLLRASAERRKVYQAMGFEEFWPKSMLELPFISTALAMAEIQPMKAPVQEGLFQLQVEE